MTNFSWIGPRLTLLGALGAGVSLAGCSENSAPGGATASEDSGPGGVTATPDTSTDTSWVVGGWIETVDAWYGVLTVVDDLSNKNSISLDDVIQFDGDFTYTSHNGSIYVGHEDNHIIDKWVVDDGVLEKVDEVSLGAFGITDTDGNSHNVIQIIDDETGWFFDHDNGRAIIFNPSTMGSTGEAIDYSEIYDGIDWEIDWPDIGDVGHVGNYIAVPMFWYHWEEPGVEPIPLETRVALINTSDGSVTIAKDDRCAGSSVMANDGDGNLYFGPHSAASLYSAEGDAGDTVPCIIRILNGETEVDQNYLVNLNEIANGRVTAGLFAGPGNNGYVLRYDGPEENLGTARFSDEWNLYRFELGANDTSLTQVEGYPKGSSATFAFTVGAHGETKHFVTHTAEQGADSAYYELLEDGSVAEGLNFPVYAGHAVNH